MLGPPGSWLDLLLRALLRGVLCGAALAVPGVTLHALGGALTPRAAIGEVTFDLWIGVFVVGPAALVEGAALRREPPAALHTAALAWLLAVVGAVAALLQSLYASAALRTGSLEAGLDEVRRRGLELLALDIAALVLCLATVVALVTLGRVARWPLARQVGVTLGAALVAGPIALGASGLPPAGVAISAVMLAIAGAALPPLSALAERLADRLRPVS